MSLTEFASRLERSFRTSQRLLTRLLTGLQERRTAWISAHADKVAPSADLESIGAELRTEDTARAVMIDELAGLLPLPPGVSAQDLHVNVTRLAAAIPRGPAHSLRRAADEVTAIANKVRRELVFGKRLLGFAQRTQEGLMADLSAGQQAIDPPGYDRNARLRRSLGSDAPAGSLIDGKM